jgi:FlaA1/EpsC-like NDP-sugar epimerase
MSTRFYWKTAQLGIDAIICLVAFVSAYLIRSEGVLSPYGLKQLAVILPDLIAARLLCGQLFGVYRISWRYVSLSDIRTFAFATSPPTIALLILRFAVPPGATLGGAAVEIFRLPLAVLALETTLFFLGVIGARILRRVSTDTQRGQRTPKVDLKPVLLIGAGRAGVVVARAIRSRTEMGLKVVGFIDDDPMKSGQVIDGLRVLGAPADLPRLVRQHSIDHVVITIASIGGADMRRIISLCESVPIRAQVVPGIYELVEGKVSFSRIRDVEFEDLLGRTPVNLDTEGVASFLRGSRIVVTGAGGSIGSEMCRQVCRFMPASLILVERYENNLFEIERELRTSHPALQIIPCVADITDEPRMERIFQTHSPQVVIHAAAHKHVPMMESNPAEAVKNNVLGTRLLADLADRFKAAVFVMISTDKAVRPKSVMGASKRLAELYVQSLARSTTTRFMTVRFGNVLGSAGSVIPIFKKQIAAGGPITVTHPEMKRYFMTIPEAAQLVLQAASMASGGEIYVLDMGEPVKIVSLAEQLIRLSGLKPYEDIEIVFTGVRPGEKLFEEISLDDENLAKTQHAKIFVGRNHQLAKEDVAKKVRACEHLVDERDNEKVRSTLIDLVVDEGLRPTTAEITASIVPVVEATSSTEILKQTAKKPELLQ